MSPENVRSNLHIGRATKGAHSPAMMIKKESRKIQKPSFSSSISLDVRNHKYQKLNQSNQLTIIYTASPKVIRTEAKDFMALVQKLTGISKSEKEANHSSSGENSGSFENNEDIWSGLEDNSSLDGFEMSNTNLRSSPTPFFSDFQPFTPNSLDFYFSSSESDPFFSSILSSPFMDPLMP